MADTLESLEIKVEHSATGAAKEIGSVTSSLTNLAKSLNKVLPQLELLSKALQGVSSPITINDVHGNNITNSVQKAGSAAKSAAKEVEPLSAYMREFIDTAQPVDILETKLVNLQEAMEQAFNDGDAQKALNYRQQIIQTQAALEKARNASLNASKGVKELAKEVAKSKSPLDNFVSSLKRIAFYRIIRGIIKSITQAFQEGLEKAYLFSQGMTTEGSRFAAAMDNIKSHGNAMKGQLGSAFISLLTAVQPILITLINLVTKAADAISQLFAAFTGKTYLKANATAAQFADTMAKGGAAAKEWKNQLLGFDEINRLNAPSDGGGGGGSNPLAGFEMVDTPINEKLLEFINNIKEKLEPALNRLKEAFGRLKEAWGKFTESLGNSAFKQFVEDLVALAGGAVINGLTILADVLTVIAEVLSGDIWGTEMALRQLLYDLIILIADLIVGVTNLAMDALIMLARGIDSVIGTNFADYLQADTDAFNAMYREAVQSDAGLFGLKRTLGLTTEATEKTADETDSFTEALANVSAQAPDTERKVNGIRTAVDWVLQGFRDFGAEVSYIITGLFQPLADLCGRIDSILQGFGLLNGINARVSQMTADGSIYLQGFASGGFPDEGQLFIANETGPEMVGTIGGRAAVAPSNDIVEAVRQGVYDAMVAANGNGNNDVSVRVYLDSREIKAGQQRLNRAWGVG